MNKDVDYILRNIGNPISRMITLDQVTFILDQLTYVVDNYIDGDVVELGCNIGTTSLYIQSLLKYIKSNKQFHVYDSFDGLPDKHAHDTNIHSQKFIRGSYKTSLDRFITNFQTRNIELPNIHVGWFKQIPDSEYPHKIALAFLDGDFYTSILDSLDKIYNKMSKNGIILIHDYRWYRLPGVEKACKDFLKDKAETVESIAFVYGDNNDYMGKIIKLN
jgi:O-methyltransferase